jgi:Tfp pilus assembly protein PilV
MNKYSRLSTHRLSSDNGFSLMETLVAAVVFTGVFLVIFSLQSKIMMSFSGGDALRVAQLADQTLSAFLDRGPTPASDTTLVVDGINYRQFCQIDRRDDLTKLRLTVVRSITGDTIGTFYTERYEQQTGQ